VERLSIKSNFSFAMTGLRRRGLRSWLTVIAIVIGIASVYALIAIGQNLQLSIGQSYESIGTDKIFVYPAGPMYGMGSTSSKITEHDLEIIKDVNGIGDAVGLIYKTAAVEYKDELKYTFVLGMPVEAEKLLESAQGFQISDGRIPNRNTDNKVLIGYLIYKGLFFSDEIGIGKKIKIEGREFEVSGVVGRIGNPQDDTQILMPIDTARELFGIGETYDMIIAQSKAGTNTSDVAEKMSEGLRKDHGLKVGEEDFVVQTSEQLIQTFNQLFAIIFIILTGISAISLIVGGVGIMNTMYTSVLERTNEIGIMKAIGAKNEDVLMMFIVESGLLGLVGGVIGVLVGIGLVNIASYAAVNYFNITYVTAQINPLIAAGMIIFSFVLGSLSGALPARQASKMNPVSALRYE
jgi:putative ABC transport system permease protein